MAVKELTQYKHYKGDKYTLLTIALPIESMPENVSFARSYAFHTELEEEIDIFNVDNVVYTEKDEFLVIYKRDNSPTIYARPVDMFFGNTNYGGKRFVEVTDDPE
ncbi:hypothetical protein [Bacillus subtilis]|uniref:hypothetical protein n=1 Tax=Bacillus subtilis TaxID=1423 RepID=UPI002DBB036A|nr:hypothetical protein [Bacillus subtilis]MEC2335146.1 DUF1653 domain-containing protein [Bacillus subtilis]